jgi:hypothetical protein
MALNELKIRSKKYGPVRILHFLKEGNGGISP